ncbi:unnamed protein product [Caretta caretta]
MVGTLVLSEKHKLLDRKQRGKWVLDNPDSDLPPSPSHWLLAITPERAAPPGLRELDSAGQALLDINDHMEKYVRIPASWRSQNFESLEIINCIVQNDLMHEIASAMFHTLAVDESTDISINRYLILYFKYGSINSADYKLCLVDYYDCKNVMLFQ